jgi:hypothetical protein
MKNVLILTSAFYPANRIDSLRPAKLAKYLPEYGWNPLIVCTKWTEGNCDNFDPALAKELENYNVVKSVRHLGALWSQPMRKIYTLASALAPPQIFIAKLLAKLCYFSIGRFPAEYYYDSISFLRKFLRTTKVDCVWATCDPPATHAVANWIHKRFRIPWVADFRDLWDQEYLTKGASRRAMLISVESKTLSSCSAIVTVSEPLKEVLKTRHEKHIYVILNGFDPGDYSDSIAKKQKTFNIVYTGKLLLHYRDPTYLFEALDSLLAHKKIDPSKISVSFYGSQPEMVKRFIANFENLDNIVRVLPRVPFAKSIEVQKQACVLLQLAHAGEKGIFTGKLFEYLGARRPILCIPGDNDCVETLLKQTRAGVICHDAKETAAQLLCWYEEWRQKGTVSYYGREEDIMKYSRKKQSQDLARLLDQVSTANSGFLSSE